MWEQGISGCNLNEYTLHTLQQIRSKIIPLWKHYFEGTDALIFVVDSNDRERMCEEEAGYFSDSSAKEVLSWVLSDEELEGVPLMVFANKQDLPKAMPVNEVADALGLNQLRNREWYIQSACATTGDGLYEGLDWIHTAINKKK